MKRGWICAWAVLALLFSLPLSAGDALDLDILLSQAREARQLVEERHLQREAEFRQARDHQQALLEQARQRALQAELDAQRLREVFEANEERLVALDQRLREATGELGELGGVVRQAAGALEVEIAESMSTAMNPARGDAISGLTDSDALPPIDALEALWLTLLEGMMLDARINRFEADVMHPSGVAEVREVTTIGPFTAIADGKYLHWLPGPAVLAELERQPDYRYRRIATELETADAGWVEATIDPTRGSLLSLLVQAPAIDERLQQGGMIGYLILVLGGAGLLLAIYRLVRLSLLARGVRQQLKDPQSPQPGNPLGRVLLVGKDIGDGSLELLESKLDEAILREIPGLERGRGVLKLLAAVAPMLGLLGTITGLIVTFQAISLFGTGDPKLMADGISQALITTLLGLSVAVPLMFLNSLLNARGSALLQTLEQRSAGLVARMLEQKHA